MTAAPVTAVRIQRIAAGGDGVGRLDDGRAVFVPRTAPGDEVELADVRLARRFGRARVARVLVPGPDRIEPPCVHYVRDQCGGCQLQHLAPDAQRAARRAIAGDALRRIGKLDVPDPPLVPAEHDWGYRAKITLHADARTRRIGYHRADRPAELFDLERCLLAAPALDTLWQAVRAHRSLLPAGLETLTLRVARDGTRHLVAVIAGGEAWGEAPALAAALRAAGAPATLWTAPEGGAPRVVAGGDERYPALAFEQVHPRMGDRARAQALAFAGDVRGRHAWDLYAGIGETTELLQAAGATVESVERDARAVAHADRLVPSGARDGVVRHAGSVEAVLGRLRPADVAIANPPRAGLGAAVTDGLLAAPPGRLVYVSCDPATLARDLVALAPRYALREVVAFDLFPQTAHVETVSWLERT